MALAVYVHVPWCLQRCPYCDFATTAVQPREIPHDGYADAVIGELAMRARHFGGPVGTLFFGGGTPSLWEPAAIARVIAAVRGTFGAPDEVTVECNPTSLDEARAEQLSEAGVTRVSIGVQSLRDEHLRYLGRLHDAGGAVRAVGDAVRAGGLRVSADLMFGMPGQGAVVLVDDARRLVDLGV
ncbi:MAG: radical SAM protein, partial [Deltaproteobacteria bacterium]